MPGETPNELYGHKFVLATRNESWGKIDSDLLGKIILLVILNREIAKKLIGVVLFWYPFISTNIFIVDSIDWTDIPYEIGYAVIQWIYTNQTPERLQTHDKGNSDIDSDESDSFVLELIRTAKAFKLQDLMNRCEESLVARVQVMYIIKL